MTQLQHVWTFEDLQALPEAVDWRPYEIVDGALVVSPSTRSDHEFASARLRRILDRAGLPAFETIGPMAIDLAPTYRIPDLLVVPAELSGGKFQSAACRVRANSRGSGLAGLANHRPDHEAG